MSKVVVHFDNSGEEIATTSIIDGAVEATRYGLAGPEFDAFTRAVRRGKADEMAAVVGARTMLLSEEEAIDSLLAKLRVQGAVRYEVKDA